jgi:hypothetical protein
MKTFLILIALTLTPFIASAQTNVIYPTSAQLGSQTAHCGYAAGKTIVGLDIYQGGSLYNSYTWNTNSPTHTASCTNTGYCVQWFSAYGASGENKGSVTVPKQPTPLFQFACYPTNRFDVRTNFPLTMVGFKP